MDHKLPLVLTTPLVWAATVGPGYFVLRTRFARPAAMLFALPTSMVLLHSSVLALQILIGSFSGPTVAGMLGLIFIAALASSPRRTFRLWPALRAEAGALHALLRRTLRNGDLRSFAVAGLILASIVVVSVDFCIDPLRRMDNSFRWGNLAERLFALRTLSFYPPRTAADFSSYVFPDGIAPELSIAFWWCFTLGGSSAPLNVLGFIQLEALWLVLLIAALARDLGGPASYRRGAVLACCATIPLGAISWGSESGLIAIGTVGALHALLQPGPGPDGRDLDSRWSYVAIVCASVAALAREYGPLTLAMTLAVLVVRRRPAKELATAAALALILAGTWYFRNWVRSGNPFYIHEMGGIFPGIPVFTHYYHFAVRQIAASLPPSQLIRLVFWLIYGAPIAWILGGVAAVRRPRHVTVVFAAAWIVIYLWATRYSSGGYGFALRVASPTIAILTALAASLPSRWQKPTAVQRGLVAAAIALLFVKTATDLIAGGGGRIWRVPLRDLIRPAEQFPWPIDDRGAAEIRRRGGRVLSSNGHLAPVMRAFAIDLVPVWSPEVRFLFDPAVPAGELRPRLRALGIGTYDPVKWEEYVSGDRMRMLAETFSSWRPLSASEPALLVED